MKLLKSVVLLSVFPLTAVGSLQDHLIQEGPSSLSGDNALVGQIDYTLLRTEDNTTPLIIEGESRWAAPKIFIDFSKSRLAEFDQIDKIELRLRYHYSGRGTKVHIQDQDRFPQWEHIGDIEESSSLRSLTLNLTSFKSYLQERGANLRLSMKSGSSLGIYSVVMLVNGKKLISDGPIVSPTPSPNPDGSQGRWRPSPGTSWQWQLSGVLNTSFDVDMYDVDLFDTPVEQIQLLKHRGIKVICYMSAGTWENWRSDRNQFPASIIGKNLSGWPGEKLLDIRKIHELKQIMAARMDLAVSKGCDGVEPDNVDIYQHDTGFSLTYNDQLQYNIMLSQEAHARNLSIGLKNDVDQIRDLEPYFDWALNESCHQYNECHHYQVFIQSGKAVFGAEYVKSEANQICQQANASNFDFLIKNQNLDSYRQTCR